MDENRICGLNAVAALFAQRANDVRRLFMVEEQRQSAGTFCAAMAAAHRPYRTLTADEMERAAGTPHHGGIMAVAVSRIVPMVDFMRPPRVPLLLVLDGVGNPHNVGAIARSAAFFGVQAILMHETPQQAGLSDAAYRVAEGGLEQLAVYKTRNLRKALEALDPFYRTVAATLTDDAVPLQTLPRDRDVALVIGNEERGVSWDALQGCRRRVRILGAGRMQSLNVAQSAAVMLHWLTNQAAV